MPTAKHNPLAKPRFKKGDHVTVTITHKGATRDIHATISKVSPSVLGTTYSWVSPSANLRGSGTIESSLTAAADPALANDPDMPGWSLGKEKRGPMMREGYFFEAPLLRDGVKVGRVMDEGQGASMRVEAFPYAHQHAFEDACNAWLAKHCPDEKYDAVDMFYGWWMDGRTKGELAADYLRAFRETINRMTEGVTSTTG